jgi:hypothetical protein
MEIPSDGEAAEVPDQDNIHDLIADAIVALQIVAVHEKYSDIDRT